MFNSLHKAALVTLTQTFMSTHPECADKNFLQVQTSAVIRRVNSSLNRSPFQPHKQTTVSIQLTPSWQQLPGATPIETDAVWLVCGMTPLTLSPIVYEERRCCHVPSPFLLLAFQL